MRVVGHTSNAVLLLRKRRQSQGVQGGEGVGGGEGRESGGDDLPVAYTVLHN
jgi:hypothetical protein